MYYSIDIFEGMTWRNWNETSDYAYASKIWHELIEIGKVVRVREVKDLTSGVRWIN